MLAVAIASQIYLKQKYPTISVISAHYVMRCTSFSHIVESTAARAVIIRVGKLLKFACIRAGGVRDAKNSLNRIDVDGKISEENRLIMAQATHAIILAGDISQVLAWKEFCLSLNLSVIAIIHSDFNGREDKIETHSSLLTGSIHYLKRGEDVSSRPMVQALAQKLVCLMLILFRS